jgi:hypothetical protein
MLHTYQPSTNNQWATELSCNGKIFSYKQISTKKKNEAKNINDSKKRRKKGKRTFTGVNVNNGDRIIWMSEKSQQNHQNEF